MVGEAWDGFLPSLAVGLCGVCDCGKGGSFLRLPRTELKPVVTGVHVPLSSPMQICRQIPVSKVLVSIEPSWSHYRLNFNSQLYHQD